MGWAASRSSRRGCATTSGRSSWWTIRQKLLSLANELKADVDKSSKDTLSLDVVRKADEIEKLAHSVKEKMKGS